MLMILRMFCKSASLLELVPMFGIDLTLNEPSVPRVCTFGGSAGYSGVAASPSYEERFFLGLLSQAKRPGFYPR